MGYLSISNPKLAVEAAKKELGITNSPYLHVKENKKQKQLFSYKINIHLQLNVYRHIILIFKTHSLKPKR